MRQSGHSAANEAVQAVVGKRQLNRTGRIRWGILGAGQIARQFAAALQRLPEAELLAIGSRTAAGAEQFGNEFKLPRRYASYAALVGDPDLEVIYVASPHSGHAEHTLLALDAGKAVLCEKPFAINRTEAHRMVQRAREQSLFLMEAMWTRYFPLMTRLRELLAAGTIGQLRVLTADFGFRAEPTESTRLFRREYGGGALLDVGVYPVSLASLLLGKPNSVTGLANLGTSGVDEEASVLLGHPNGAMALLHMAVRLETVQEAILTGTQGKIQIHSPWWRPTAMTVSRAGQADERLEFPLMPEGNGYEYEASEVMNCLRAGKTESARMSLDESLTIMETLDTLRGKWGLWYPADRR